MANTNSTVYTLTAGLYTVPAYTTKGNGTITTVGKDVMGVGTYFQGIKNSSQIVLGGTVDAITGITLGYYSGGPNPTGGFAICGAVPAAASLTLMAADIATAINAYSTSNSFMALSSGTSVFIYPVEPNNTDALLPAVQMASTSTMTTAVSPFTYNEIAPVELRGQQWIFNSNDGSPELSEVAKVDFVRDSVSAHLKDAFVNDITTPQVLNVIEENHWHAINFLNNSTVAGYIDGALIGPGVSVSFNKANQNGFGSFNMIDPKVVYCPEGCSFLVSVL